MATDALASGWAKALGGDRKQFNMFIEKMMDGFAYHKIVVDKAGKPIDYVFLEVNHAFEKMTGLKREQIIGKKVTEVLVGIEKDPADWIGVYGKVALTGEPVQFENYAESLGKWFKVSAYCPEKGYFVALFEDITERKKAEEALKESEERWATTLASIGDAVVATDTDGKISFMNKVAEEITGWCMVDAWQKPISDVFKIINEDTRREVEGPVSKVLEKGMVVGLANHSVLIRKDGTEVPIDDSGAPIKDKEGKTIGVVLVFRDITERKKAEEEIARLASFPTINPNPILEIDFNGNIEYANPAAKARFADLKVLGLKHPLLANWEDVVKTFKEKTANTCVIEVKIGEDWYLQQYYNVPKTQCVRSYALKITERKKAEEALRESESTLQNILDGTPSFIFLKDRNGRFITINKRLEESLGMKREALRGKTDYDIFSKEVADFYRKNDLQVLETKQPIQTEEVFDSPDGKKYTLLANKFPLFNASGEVTATCSISTDITERKKAEEALKQSEQRYSSLFNSIPEGFCLVEIVRDENNVAVDLRFIEINDAYAKAGE